MGISLYICRKFVLLINKWYEKGKIPVSRVEGLVDVPQYGMCMVSVRLSGRESDESIR